jgi:hypothetical protein
MDQPTVLIEGGQLPAKVIEEQGFDRLNMQTRTNVRQIGNTLRVPDYEAGLDALPGVEERSGTDKVVGFDDVGQPILVELDTLNSASALDQAVDSATSSANDAATSETNALNSAVSAANSALSAKGFIVITTQNFTDIPTAYPTDQVSVMGVDISGGGGTWPNAGTVITYGFTSAISQTYIPGPDTTGESIQTRFAQTSGTTWSPLV